MKKRPEKRKPHDGLRREYDLSKLKGVRGKYTARYKAGTNLALLSPDVAEYFPDTGLAKADSRREGIVPTGALSYVAREL